MKQPRTILEMKPLPKGFFRIKIHHSDQDMQLKLHQETVFKYRLSKGQTLDETTWQDLIKDDAYHTLVEYALARLAEQDHTRAALKAKLKRRKAEDVLVERVLNHLESMAVLNETRALARLKEDFLEGPPKGPKLFKQVLTRAGFDETTVRETLDSIDASVWSERCESYCSMALSASKPETYLVRKRKLMTGALSKGFEHDMIEPLVEKVLKQATPADEAVLLAKRFDQLKKRYTLREPKERQALIRALLRQGFAYAAIHKMLESEGDV